MARFGSRSTNGPVRRAAVPTRRAGIKLRLRNFGDKPAPYAFGATTP